MLNDEKTQSFIEDISNVIYDPLIKSKGELLPQVMSALIMVIVVMARMTNLPVNSLVFAIVKCYESQSEEDAQAEKPTTH